MRCPKCGFISFDDRVACTKCQLQFDGLNLPFRGTAIQVESVYFLGSNAPAPAETGPEPAEEATAAAPDNSADLYEELAAESMNPHLTGRTASDADELDLSAVKGDVSNDLSFEEPEIGEESIFDLGDVPGESGSASAEAGQHRSGAAAQPPVSLEEIDLSDLVSESDSAEPITETADSVFDLSDIIAEYGDTGAVHPDSGAGHEASAPVEDELLMDVDFNDLEQGGREIENAEELRLEMAAEEEEQAVETAAQEAQPKPPPSGLAMENEPGE